MRQLSGPLCLFLALTMVILGFGLLAVDSPQPSADLHGARAAGDQPYGDALEAQLSQRRWARKVLLASLFVGAGVFTVMAFMSIRPS